MVPHPIRRIYYSSHFEQLYRALPPATRQVAKQKEAMFRADAFHPSLRTHKLKGRLAGRWAFSVAYDVRVIFRFLEADEALFLAIGSHSEVY